MSERIIKVKRERDFTIIPNAVMRDNNLTLAEMGLLCYLLHLPPDFALFKRHLHANFKNGRDSTINAFNGLIQAGYILREEIRDASGKITGVDFFVFDERQPLPGNQATEPAVAWKPGTGKSVNGFSGNIISNNHTKKTGKQKDTPPDFAENPESKNENPETLPPPPPPSSGPAVVMPWETDSFRQAWEHWKAYKKKQHRFTYKSPESEQAALKKLAQDSTGREDIAVRILEDSMGNGYQGFGFPSQISKILSNGNTAHNQQRNSARATAESVHDELRRRYPEQPGQDWPVSDPF